MIFDGDDTVIATAKTRWKVLISTAGSFGVRLTEETILRSWGLPFDRLIRTIVPTIDYGAFVKRYRAEMRVSRSEPTTGSAELLADLAARGTRLEIVTSSGRELITQDLDELDLTRYFERIYGHEETPFPKPDPRVLDVVIDNLAQDGYQLPELVYIGDSVRDLKVASARSVGFVAVLSGIESMADFIAAGLPPERVVGDLGELIGGLGSAGRESVLRQEFSLSEQIEVETREGRFHLRHLSSAVGPAGVLMTSPREPAGPVPVRIHSSCLFGESLSATDCDCESQLRQAKMHLAHYGGHLVYLHDEGRGTGLATKFRAIGLQQAHGIDTAAAFTRLGIAPDPRDFLLAADVVASLVGSRPVVVLTNNPRKLEALADAGVTVAGRLALVPEAGPARRYLEEKIRVLGHLPERPPALRLPAAPALNHAFVELHAPDLEEQRQFYTALGFDVVWERSPEREKGYLVLRLAGNVLCFRSGDEYVHGHPGSSDTRRRENDFEVVLMVAGIQDVYERFPHRSSIVEPLAERPWGASDFQVVDPAGFHLRFSEPHDILDPRHGVS